MYVVTYPIPWTSLPNNHWTVLFTTRTELLRDINTLPRMPGDEFSLRRVFWLLKEKINIFTIPKTILKSGKMKEFKMSFHLLRTTSIFLSQFRIIRNFQWATTTVNGCNDQFQSGSRIPAIPFSKRELPLPSPKTVRGIQAHTIRVRSTVPPSTNMEKSSVSRQVRRTLRQRGRDCLDSAMERKVV